jgi:hypothetical protein
MNVRSRPLKVVQLVALVWFLPLFVFGHETGLSTAEFKFATNGLEAELTLASADATAIVAHAGTLQMPANHEGALTQEEVGGSVERLRQLAMAALEVEFDGRRAQASAPRFAIDEKANFHVLLTFLGDRPGRLRIRSTLFAHLPPQHITFISVHDLDGKSLGNKMLNANENAIELAVPASGAGGGSGEPRATTFWGFLLLGVKHIWTGYDHLLFLSALLIVCPNFRSAIQVVTCFTVAHSLTLAFATVNLVWVSSRVVEPAIAASIIYVGVENFLRPEGPQGRWLITFLFGLVHGLGFASVLRDLGVSSSTTGITLPLVGFNLGVETGQLVVACLLLPLIWKLRSWEPFLKRGVAVCSAVVAAAGCYWLAQRIWFA